uniref:Katanin p80 subunit C-terminal domain-containing protein n=1 Tax=Ciona savignyi TaxID=51511 RepID=H2YGH4_CIOSA
MSSMSHHDQITQGHAVMLSVLQSRTMRLNAALTFWKNDDIIQLISYILRTDDDSLLVDILPFLTQRLAENEKHKHAVTLGVCVDLLPVIERLLKKKYEDYVVVSLDFIRTIVKTWYRELSNMKNSRNYQSLNASLNLPPVYSSLLSLHDLIQRLANKSGPVATKAKVVHEMLNHLK